MNTKYDKIEFGRIDFFGSQENPRLNTYGENLIKINTFKVAKKEKNQNSFLCSRNINLADQKMKDAYRKVNKMIGGY